MRIFIGLPISTNTRSIISNICDTLKHIPVKWIKSENWHITLRFLGETPVKKIPELELALTEIIQQINPFTLEFKTLNMFPLINPHCLVIYVALDESLAKLFYQINQTCDALGFQPDLRPFLPHITLAKFNSPPKLPALNNLALPITETVNQVILYESKNDIKEGSAYYTVSCYQLVKKANSASDF